MKTTPYTTEERKRIKAAYDTAWRKEPKYEERKLAGRRAANEVRDEIDFDRQMSFVRACGAY